MYRVTKYDPGQRDSNGAFLPEDWTSASDIGKSIAGKTITKHEYLEVENNYVKAAKQLLLDAGIGSMRITNLEVKLKEKSAQLDDIDLVEKCKNLNDTAIVAVKDLEDVIKGCLREYIWCQLAGPQKSYLHFGYDYYMYIGLPKSASVRAVPKGIFLEEVESPYLSDN
jgi:hypothetical protein